MIKAFVLIVVDPAKTMDVFNKLNAVEGISEVYQVMGPYDIVAVVEVSTLTDVPAVISRHIRAVDGIESTTTCVTFPEAASLSCVHRERSVEQVVERLAVKPHAHLDVRWGRRRRVPVVANGHAGRVFAA